MRFKFLTLVLDQLANVSGTGLRENAEMGQFDDGKSFPFQKRKHLPLPLRGIFLVG